MTRIAEELLLRGRSVDTLVTIGTGFILLLIEYSVFQHLARRADEPTSIQQSVEGRNKSVKQTINIDRHREMVINRVTHVHNQAPPRRSGGEPTGDTDSDVLLWMVGALVLSLVATLALAVFGAVLRAALQGVALGLLLLAGALALWGRDTIIPIKRWVAACVMDALLLGFGTHWLLARVFNGVSLGDIQASRGGLSTWEQLRAVLDLGGVAVAIAFAFQVMGALVLTFTAAMLTLRVTGVFAAVGALQENTRPRALQAWLVAHFYNESYRSILALEVLGILGALLGSGALSDFLLIQDSAGPTFLALEL